MLWRSIKHQQSLFGNKAKTPQLSKHASNESMDGTTVATEEMYPAASPRDVRDVASYSSDKSGAKHASLKSKTELTISISDGEDVSASLKSPSLSRTSSFRKSSTPKSVSFAISNWKRFSMTGVSAPLLLSLDTLLAEQRLVYGIDMFDELSDEDQRESEFLQSYSYKFEEAALVIFNRKRELVIPAPGELYRIAAEAKADNAKTSPAKGQQYAAERHRRHQFVLATLSEDEQMCLSMLLSEQEAKFKTNMFDAMTDDDEAEVASLLAQGYKYDDVTHMIFQRKYEPNKPAQLVHPMQQRFHPSHGYSHHGHRGLDDGSVHSANSFSMRSAVSMASLTQSPTSPRNLFQPMAPSPGTPSSSAASVATENLQSATVTQDKLNTPPAHPHRRPSHFHFNHTYAPYSSSNGSVYSAGSASYASSAAPAFHMPAPSSGQFFMPSSSVPSGGSIASSHSGANAHVQSKPNLTAAAPMRSPMVTASVATSTQSSPAPLTKSVSAPASTMRMWNNPLRSSAGSSNSSVVSQGNLSAQSDVASAATASSTTPVVNISSPSVASTAGTVSNEDAEALAMAILAQRAGNANADGNRLLRTRSAHTMGANPLASPRRPSMVPGRSPISRSASITGASRPKVEPTESSLIMNL